MAKWKQIATLDDNGNLPYPTTGAALTVTIDNSLGAGGTGNTSLTASDNNALMVVKNGKLEAIAPPTSGNNLVLGWNGTTSEPAWLDPTTASHAHSEFFDTTSTDDKTLYGNITFDGNLSVNGTASFPNVSVAVVSNSTIVLDTTNSDMTNDSVNKGIVLDDGDGNTADNPGIFWHNGDQRWGVGRAGAYEKPLMIFDKSSTPTNNATASTGYNKAIGTIACNGENVFIVVDES